MQPPELPLHSLDSLSPRMIHKFINKCIISYSQHFLRTQTHLGICVDKNRKKSNHGQEPKKKKRRKERKTVSRLPQGPFPSTRLGYGLAPPPSPRCPWNTGVAGHPGQKAYLHTLLL